MRVEYFDLPHEPETRVALPWPICPLSWRWNHQDDRVRMYYTVLPEAKTVEVMFYMVESNQELPALFPGKYVATVHPENLDERYDAAIHIFIETPVNKPDEPIIINEPNE